MAAVSTKVLERQAAGQLKPIVDHLGKLGSPNQPGGNDPRNRSKWKDDARRALDRLRKIVDKMKGKQQERWEETYRRFAEEVGDAR